MTSTPVILLSKRSGLSSDRPSGTILQGGELALCFGAADPGLYFEDSAGSIRKIGPSSYATTAPNSTPAGLVGNSVGELWTDSSTADCYLKVWTGSAWKKISAGFADTAAVATATYAIQAGSAIIASGAILASGALQANTALLSSGTILASGALRANTATLASGAILASGVIQGSTVVLSGLPLPSTQPSGSLYYQVQPSGAFAAGMYVRATNTWLLV